jgi:uncharacterized phage-associated protein
MPNHRVEAIANEFLKLARAQGASLTNMQLQKLPYIAHGWSLALIGEPLIADVPQAWQYGPVYPGLHRKLRRYGAGQVTDLIHENDDLPLPDKTGPVITTTLSPPERELLAAVWAGYSKYDAFQLSALTHVPDSPWSITTEQDGPSAPIPNDRIKAHYQHLAKTQRASPAPA